MTNSSLCSTPVLSQLGRELVEVPSVVSQVVEQNVDIPVRYGGGGRSKIPQGFLSRQCPTAGFGGGLPGLRPGQGSTVQAPAPVVEYISPASAVFQARLSVVIFKALSQDRVQQLVMTVEVFKRRGSRRRRRSGGGGGGGE